MTVYDAMRSVGINNTEETGDQVMPILVMLNKTPSTS